MKRFAYILLLLLPFFCDAQFSSRNFSAATNRTGITGLARPGLLYATNFEGNVQCTNCAFGDPGTPTNGWNVRAGDFLDRSNYVKWSNTQSAGKNSLTQETDTTNGAGTALAVTVHRSDGPTSGSIRAEAQDEDDPGNPNFERWYGVSVYFANGYPTDNCCESFIQWHDNGGPAPPFSLQVTNNSLIAVLAANGSADPKTIVTTLIPDRWYDFVMHIKWSTTSNGFIDVWVDDVLKASWSSVQTNVAGGCYLKLGVNNFKQYPVNTSIVDNRRLFYNQFRIANQTGVYASVDPHQ